MGVFSGQKVDQLISSGYRVQFLEQFFSSLFISNGSELSHAMNMAKIPTTRAFYDVT